MKTIYSGGSVKGCLKITTDEQLFSPNKEDFVFSIIKSGHQTAIVVVPAANMEKLLEALNQHFVEVKP